MAAGYIGLGLFKEPGLFYTSLALIIVGNGFFKPTISTVLGNLIAKNLIKPIKIPVIISSIWGLISEHLSVILLLPLCVINSDGEKLSLLLV
jgi:hypothetical protein